MRKIRKIIVILILFCGIIGCNKIVYAVTVNDYNNYIESGKLFGLGDFCAHYNPHVLKYRKYGHFAVGDSIKYPSGNPEIPFNEMEGDRILADQAISTDDTYKVTGQFNYDAIDYSYYDEEDLNSHEFNRKEFQSRLDVLEISNIKSGDQGYGAYNLRAGKNLIAFIKFAYDFYVNASGEIRVGCDTFDKLVAKGITEGGLCPMEYLKGFADLSDTNIAETFYEGFNPVFRTCTTDWVYMGDGDENIANDRSIFANLQYYYMALVYLQPGLRKFRGLKRNDFDCMGTEDVSAFLSMMYERFGGRPIILSGYSANQLTNALGEIGENDILPALIETDMDVGERIYRYMIEIKYRNNPEALARWVAEYEEVYGRSYEVLDSEEYAVFKKACDEGYRRHPNQTPDTALDFGYVIDPSKYESRISFDSAIADMASHYQANFRESQFYRNRNNAEYVAKTYAMAKAMCENEAFSDITDIYAAVVNLVEHSYGYDSSEILLADTQVVHLVAPLEEGEYDTDLDNLYDRQELNHEENVNISNLLDEYIKYNKIPEEAANKLKADPYIKMWSYKSNPSLPDSDFDGRNDDFDIYRPLDNRQEGRMSTINYDSVKFSFDQDYRYFFMPSTQYYYELSMMGMVLSNMVNKKGGANRRWEKDTLYRDRIYN